MKTNDWKAYMPPKYVNGKTNDHNQQWKHSI